MTSDIPLLLFAKAPVSGRVKTRLQSHCSAEQAAQIACLLMEESIKTTTRHWPGKVFLSVWLDHKHPFFQQMQARYSVTVTQQCDGDLGEKMRHALERFGYPAAVMGCDAPHTSAAALQKAYQCLRNGDSVIGPSVDGGYYFLGLSRSADELFHDKGWGTSGVLAATLESAAAIKLELARLPALNDVDEWSDVIELAPTLTSLSDYLLSQGLVDAVFPHRS